MVKTNFTVACSLLSQYLKQKGSLEGLVAPSLHEPKGSHRTPTTMCLLPGVDISDDGETEIATDIAVKPPPSKSEGDCAPLTIFYGGKVMVFDNFPAEKAMDLVKFASKSFTTPNAAAADGGVDIGLQMRSPPSAACMPQSRRASLHRFLEKRKDRILANAPYKANDSPASAAPSRSSEELPAWMAAMRRSMAM